MLATVRRTLLALACSFVPRVHAVAQEDGWQEPGRVAAWRAAVERVNDRLRSSSISWLDGHLGVPSVLRMAPDGGRVVTWAQDGSAWLWNAWTGEPIGLLGMFGMGETSTLDRTSSGWPRIAFSADGERILLHEPLAGLVGLWDGRSAEFLGYLESGEDVAVAAAFSPDGRRVAVATAPGTVRFFDADSGLAREAPVFEAGAVEQLAFHPDGSQLLSSTLDGRARLWDAATGALLAVLGSDELPVAHPGFSADGTRVLGTGPNGVALVYSTRLPAGTAPVPTVVRAPEGSWLAADWGTGRSMARGAVLQAQEVPVLPHGNRLVVFLHGKQAMLWDPEAGAPVAPLTGAALGPDSWTWIGFSPDGERLLTIGSGKAQLWNAITGAHLADIHAPAVHGAFSPSSRYVATASSSSGVPTYVASLHDARTGRFVKRIALEFSTVFGLHFSANDRLGATSAWGWSTVWDAGGAEVVLEPHALQVGEEGLDPGLARWSAEGSRVLTSSWGRRTWFADRLWDPRSGAVVRELPSHGFSGGGFAGDALVSLRSAGTTTVIDVKENGLGAKIGILPGDRIARVAGKPLEAEGGLRGACLSAPAKTSIVVLRAGRELELPLEYPSAPAGEPSPWRNLGVGERMDVRVDLLTADGSALLRSIELQRLPGRYLYQAAASSDASRLLVRTGVDASLFDLASGERLADFTPRTWQRFTTYDAMMRMTSLSPGGDAVAVSEPSGLRLWTEGAGFDEEVLAPAMRDLEFSPDGWWLAGASADGSVLVWDLADRKLVHEQRVHRGETRFIAFDQSSRRLVSAGGDGTVCVIDLEEEGEPLVLAGHAGLPNRPAFAPDGSRVLTIGDDGTGRLWDARTGAAIAVLEGHVGPVTYGSFSPDGTRILTQAKDGSTRIWDGTDGRLLATRVEYDDGFVLFEPSGFFMAGGAGAEHAQMVVNGRRYPLSSYAAIHESPEKVAESLAGEVVRAPSFVPQAPELRVAAPLDPLVPEREFRLEVLIDDAYGIESVSVNQDGRELDAGWIAEHLVASGRSSRLSCQLALPEGANETTIHVRATNARKIKSAPRTVFVRWQPPQRELYVLALGVADYEDDRLDLAYPVNDADDLIARFAAEQGGYYEAVNTQRLIDAEVTPGKLRKAREEFLLRARPEDTIVVFAAGHGVRSESGEYYFLTPGATPDDPYDGIDRPALESLVTWDRLHAGRRILLIDTCHSGDAFGDGKRGVAPDLFDQQAVDEAAGTGLYIIAASSEQGFAQEMGGNGLFTRCLLEGLDGAADRDGDGLVGIGELETYATAAVHERSGGRQRPTVPRVEGGEDFPLARTKPAPRPR